MFIWEVKFTYKSEPVIYVVAQTIDQAIETARARVGRILDVTDGPKHAPEARQKLWLTQVMADPSLLDVIGVTRGEPVIVYRG